MRGSPRVVCIRLSFFDDCNGPILEGISANIGKFGRLLNVGRFGVADETPDTDDLQLSTNLGGAGGFSYAILSALASGAEWIWMMDDDAYPVGEDCLAMLLKEADARKLDVVSPLIVAPEDQTRLSFPFRLKGKLCYDRAAIEELRFVPSVAHFFNGALIRREVFFKVGLPDMRLFLRGDEVDFMVRLRKAGIPFGTVTSAVVAHPPGWGEVQTIVRDRLAILIPETEFKRYYFFRNRGYLARRHRRLFSLLADIALYPYVYMIKRRGDFRGLSFWWSAFRDGLGYRFDRAPHFDELREHRDGEADPQ